VGLPLNILREYNAHYIAMNGNNFDRLKEVRAKDTNNVNNKNPWKKYHDLIVNEFHCPQILIKKLKQKNVLKLVCKDRI
jgi:hypothetical protein